MSCPPGYRDTYQIVNGRRIVSCTPVISNQPETCSDSEFYRSVTGLPPCGGPSQTGNPGWPFSWPQSSDPEIRAIEDKVAENFRRMNVLKEQIDAAKQNPNPGDIYVYPRMEEVPGPPLNLPSRADQKANIFNKAFDPNKRKIIVLVIAGFLLFLAVTNAK